MGSEDILRPIIGIENRTAQEVFDIMCDRFGHRIEATRALSAEVEEMRAAAIRVRDNNRNGVTGSEARAAWQALNTILNKEPAR